MARVRGYSADWHDYRAYEPGDDPRGIDWNIYARLRQLAVKVSRADAHVELHLLVDSSRSMSIGDPQKLSCAARLAAAIAYVTLAQHDRVAFAGFDHVLRGAMQPAAGRAQGRRILDALSELRPHGPSSSASALRAYACTVRGPAFAVVLSDFLEADDPRAGLRELLQAGIVPAVVQIVADEELDPSIEGEV